MYERTTHVNVRLERGSTFIHARKIYLRKHLKITRQWKSTLNGIHHIFGAQSLHVVCFQPFKKLIKEKLVM